MRILVLVALFLIIPHLTNGAPGSNRMKVNGESSAASDIVVRKEMLKQLKESRTPAFIIHCPTQQQVREGNLQGSSNIGNESTSCLRGELLNQDEKSNSPLEEK